MATEIGELIEAVRNLGKSIEASRTDDMSLRDQFGWNFPDLTRIDMAKPANRLADRLATIPPGVLNPKYSIDRLVKKVASTQAQVIPQLWSGNGVQAYSAYWELIAWIDDEFRLLYKVVTDWEELADAGFLPKQIAGKLRSMSASVNKLGVNRDELRSKVAYIEEAHDAALALPTDLDSLREAAQAVDEHKKSAERSQVLADSARDKADEAFSEILGSREEAMRLVENIEDAYSAATTKGLGQSFQERASQLDKSMWIWVGGLISALIIGAALGSHRVNTLQSLLTANAGAGLIWLNLVLAFFSIAAPVWFAWIATKQIGHRFRLSEDYGFKASVARAYEGYRREAARLDPEFAKRLFASALARLDEAPIRFVETETYGSPWHEALKLRRERKAQEAVVKEERAVEAVLKEEE